MMMNELIREYLEFNQYRHTLSVFLSESGQPAERLRRQQGIRPSAVLLHHRITVGPADRPRAVHAGAWLHPARVRLVDFVCSAFFVFCVCL